MKKMIIAALVLLSTGSAANAQNATNKQPLVKTDLISSADLFENGRYSSVPPGTNGKDYLTKSRNKKTTAWVFLGGGALCTGIGILIFPKNYDSSPLWNSNSASTENQASVSEVVTVIGIAAMISSIPFFVSSSMNKRKASISMSNQKTGFGVPPNVGKNITGISMTIPIGK